MTNIERPKIAEHNIETDEFIVREMTDEELTQYEIDLADAALESAKIDAKIAAKASARAKLAALGLTEDEIAAL